MKKVLKATTLGAITATAMAAAALLALWAGGGGPPPVRANHNVTLGLDMNPFSSPANTATSLGSIDDCLSVTAGPYNDDGDGATEEDPHGNANFDGAPGVAGQDDDGDTKIDEDSAGFQPGNPDYTNDLADDDDEDGLVDEDPSGQLFQFDAYITVVGEHGSKTLSLFQFPLGFDETVMYVYDVDVYWFLNQGGATLLDTSDPAFPDTDGRYLSGAYDTTATAHTGTGVLARFTGQAVGAGVTAIDVPTLDLTGDTINDHGPKLLALDLTPIGDGNGDGYFDQSPIGTGTVAVDDALACDPDWDDDGVLNENDNCPDVANGAAQAGIPRVGNQTNTDGDPFGDACDSDIDGDGFPNTKEDRAASNAVNVASLVEVCDGIDNDLDTAVDEDGLDHDNDGAVNDPGPDADGDTIRDCLDNSTNTDGDGLPNSTDTDDDGDGSLDTWEKYMGTDSLDKCADNTNDEAWPPDFNNNRTVNIIDVLNYGPVILTSYGQPKFNRRYDLNANAAINIIDVLMIGPYILQSCTNP